MTTVERANQLVAEVLDRRRERSKVAAREYAAAAALARELDACLAADELAPAVRMSPGAADGFVSDALLLASLPMVLGLFGSGLIDEWRALTIARGLDAALDPQDPRWARLEALVCLRAPVLTAGQIQALIQRLVIEVDPDTAHREHEKARQGRGVASYPDRHGMATVIAKVPGADAAIIMATLHAMADVAMASGAAAGRTRDQLLADALTELCQAVADGRPITLLPAPAEPVDVEPDENLLPADLVQGGFAESENGGAMPTPVPPAACPPRTLPDVWHPIPLGTRQGSRSRLVLHADLDTLLGVNDLPADLVRYGAITAQAARDLAKRCDSADLVVQNRKRTPVNHPPAPTGRPRDWGPENLFGPGPGHALPEHLAGHEHDANSRTYRPVQGQRRYLAARYRSCVMPGCTRPAQLCEAEHVRPFRAGGPTCRCNLVPCCKRHHQLKTRAGWTYRLHPDGSLTWTSELGRSYWVPPPDDPGARC